MISNIYSLDLAEQDATMRDWYYYYSWILAQSVDRFCIMFYEGFKNN